MLVVSWNDNEGLRVLDWIRLVLSEYSTARIIDFVSARKINRYEFVRATSESSQSQRLVHFCLCTTNKKKGEGGENFGAHRACCIVT